MKNLLTFSFLFVIGIYGCEKEALTAIGDQAAFDEIHKIVNGKHFENDNGATLNVTDEKVKFNTPQGHKHEFKIDSVRGNNDQGALATYYGGEYVVGIQFSSLNPDSEIVAAFYEGSQTLFFTSFEY